MIQCELMQELIFQKKKKRNPEIAQNTSGNLEYDKVVTSNFY